MQPLGVHHVSINVRDATESVAADVPGNCGQHFAIRVADLDDTIAELRGRSVDVGDPSGVGRARQAFLTDPSGNLIELHEPAQA